MILLDTNVAIAVLRGRPPEVRNRLRAALAAGEEVAIASVVLLERRHGAARSASPARNHARADAFLAGRIGMATFVQADADEPGRLRAELERAAAPIGAYDVPIAGQARRRWATLVTHDTREFGRVAGLALEHWEEGWSGAVPVMPGPRSEGVRTVQIRPRLGTRPVSSQGCVRRTCHE